MGLFTTRMMETHMKKVPEEAATLDAETAKNHFPCTSAIEEVKKLDNLPEEASDLSIDNDAEAEEQQIKTAYTICLQIFWDLHLEMTKFITQT